MKPPVWEEVAQYTYRLSVPGGWLYMKEGLCSMAMCFVPNTSMVSTMPAHVPVPEDAGWDPEWRGG